MYDVHLSSLAISFGLCIFQGVNCIYLFQLNVFIALGAGDLFWVLSGFVCISIACIYVPCCMYPVAYLQWGLLGHVPH